VYICDHWAPNVPLFESVDGIHTHGDGVIHIHPFTANAAGPNATLGFFIKAIPGGFKVSATELKFPKVAGDTNPLDAKDWKNGMKCPDGQTGKVKFTVNGKQQNFDASTWKLRNGDYLDVGFIDDSKPLPSNPQEKANLANINDVSTSTGTTTPTTVPGATTTPANPSATTSPTTSAPATSAPASEAPTTAAPTTAAPTTTSGP
jgi:hypothetical protein